MIYINYNNYYTLGLHNINNKNLATVTTGNSA